MLISCVNAFAQGLTYNNIFSTACHNCYEPQYASAIEDVFSYTKTIEIDIWDSEMFSGITGGYRMSRDWYVRHSPLKKGNINCCGGTLLNCLTRIKEWSDKNKNHDVVTIFLDKEENWSQANETRKPTDLDELLLSIFSAERIFTPAKLMRGKSTLKEAVSANWPCMDSLKRKFIFVITDATAGHNTTGRKPLDEYLSTQKDKAVCFVAPKISSEKEITNPKGITKENATNVVFYNLKYPIGDLPEKINKRGFVSRVYGAAETKEALDELIHKKVNFIALYNYILK